MRTPTLKDVAAEAGLSISTISRALAGNPVIPEETRKRALEAARRLGYRPNAQARALRSSKTDTIGVIIPNVSNQYFAELAQTIQTGATLANKCVVVATSNDDPYQLISALGVMENQRVDGVIVVPHIGTASAIQHLIDLNIPVVLLDRGLDGIEAPVVTSDPRPGLHAACRLLIENRYGRIGYLAGPDTTTTAKERLDVFQSMSHAAWVTTHEGGYSMDEGYTAASALLDQGVEAIVAGDSMMTMGALRAIYERGLEVGKDVALVGFDDFDTFVLQPRPITIIDQNVTEMGDAAFTMLEELIKRHPVESVKIPTRLIVRDSTARERGANKFFN